MKNISIIIICLFLLFPVMNFGTSMPLLNNSLTSETDYSIDSSVINNAQEQRILQNINQFDGYFTENCGQLSNDDVRFYAKDNTVWFTDDGVWFELREEIQIKSQESRVGSRESDDLSEIMNRLKPPELMEYKRVVLKQEFLGANDVRPMGKDRLSWNSNYFYGNDSTKWCTSVPNYQEIIYENIYEKIDLRYYSSEKGLKYDFIVHPGGEPSDIRIKYEGAQELHINPSGDLEIRTQSVSIVDSDLFIYQNLKNNIKVINGIFKLFTPSVYGFEIIGNYDRNQDLIIDPLVYSTFIGGSDTEGGEGIEIDSNGNAYVTGSTFSLDFPTTTGAYDMTHNGVGTDVFVIKLNPSGSTLLYSTFIGGSAGDGGEGIEIDSSGNAYVTGSIRSSDFPTTTGAYDRTHNGEWDVYVLKLNPTGSALLYSTFIGGNNDDWVRAIQIDLNGNAYITGACGANFPNTTGVYDMTHNGGFDVFVLKLNPMGSALLYSTFIGGSEGDWGNSIQIDSSGKVYVTGYTGSTDFPNTTGVYDMTHNGNNDAFVLKLNPTGSVLLFSTFIGGSEGDESWGIQIDSSGNVYVTGFTYSSDFPTTNGAYDMTLNGTMNAFVLKLNPTGSAILFSTYIGGSPGESSFDIQIDSFGNVYITGQTVSLDFPTTNGAYDTTYGGWGDLFLIKLDSMGSALLYSTFIGGNGTEGGKAIAVDTNGNAYVTGSTRSSDFPTTPGAFDTTFNSSITGTFDCFVLKIGLPNSPLFLSYPKVTPLSGNTNTQFNFTVKYFHQNNSSPTGVKVIVDGTEYSMLEVDSGDINYTNGKDYFLNITHLNIGEHTCKFWASNGTKTILTGLFNLPKVLNTPPKIITQDNLTAIEDTYYEVSYEFEDMDVDNVGQYCSWDFATNAKWLRFISNPPTLGGTPTNDDVGKYWVNISISDSIEIDYTNFTLTVIDINNKPIITTTNVEQIYEDELYEVDYSASDIDSPIENQIWSLETNTSLWLNLNTNSGVLNGTPTNYDVGSYWVNVSVNDNEGGADFTNFTLTVINVNDPPYIITDDLTFVRLGDFYEVDYVAADIDSPASDLIWSLETNASWLNLNSSSGVLNGTPTYDDIGLYVVNVSVDDGDGGSDWHEFELSVLNRISNFPPEIETSDLTEIMVNEFYRVDYNATDDHTPSDQLIWNLETNASWLNIDLMTGVLSGTPTEADAGWYWVKITVWDGEDGWNVHNFTVMVKKEPSIRNNAPILSKPKMSPEAGDTKTEFIFSVDYYDAEGEPPVLIQLVMDIGTYDLELRSGETANGTYQYTINLPEGQHKYYFTASDGLNKVNTDRFFTNNIQKEKQVSKGENSVGFIVAIIIIIIIVLIFLFFIIFRKKKKQKEEAKIELAPAIPTPVLDISSYPTTTYPSQQIDQPPTDIPLLITQPAPTETASQEPASEPVVHIEESQSMVNVENGLMLKVGKEGELKPVQKDVDEESKNNKNEI